MNKSEIHGVVAPGFESVREKFAAFIAETHGETGSQLAAYHHGRFVVNLWAGDGIDAETLTGVHSVTKGATSLVAALLHQDGALDLDSPIADVWPKFGQAGKAGITVRDLLTHRAGVIGIGGGITVDELADESGLADRLAATAPLWRPGTAQGYAGFVFGAVLGEVVKRLCGQTVQQVFAERVREPYGLDLYLGLPEELEPRYREILPWIATPEQEAGFAASSPNPRGIAGIGYNLGDRGFTPQTVMTFPNHRAVRASGQASGGGVGSATGIAALFAAMTSDLDGRPPLLKTETLDEFSMVHSTGPDLVRGEGVAFALGFEARGVTDLHLGAGAIGHGGSAGSDGFTDPASGVAFGYTRRRAAFAFDAPERATLAEAVITAARHVERTARTA